MDKRITDELLAAYLDGNTSAAETEMVLNAIRENTELQEFLRLSDEIDNDLYCEEDDEIGNICINEFLPYTALAAESKSNLCNVLCELYILESFGVSRTVEEYEEIARKQGWLQEEGTALHNIGRLLEMECYSISRRFHCSLEDICRSLKNKEKVIAVIDSTELKVSLSEAIAEDILLGKRPNHSVVVTEVLDDSVSIFNPSTGNIESYPKVNFVNAWEDSSHYLVTVTERDIRNYEAHPIDLSDVELTDELIELREAIAENAHEVWAKKRQSEGWTYGPSRNDVLKQTPDMVPYSDLTDKEKSYDREMAMETIKLLKKLGWDLVKQS